MNIFDVNALSHILNQLAQAQTGLLILKMQGHGGIQVGPELCGRADKAIALARQFCQIYELQDCLKAVGNAEYRWQMSPMTLSI